MRLAIFSDFHLGFGEKGVRKDESFDNAKSGFEIALREKVDAILLAGDLFDSSVPSQETLLKSFRLFSLANNQLQSNVQIKIESKKGIRDVSYRGCPVLSIHGTHEFRGKDYANVLELLNEAGYLIYFHAAKTSLEKDGEKVCIHGLGGIPESKALDALKMWNPKPESGVKNLLVLHQSFKEFLPTDDPMAATLSLDDLPKGFDLVINGHLHWTNITELGESKFLLSGSTITTQMKRLEGEKKKGIYIYDTKTDKLDFVELPNQRKLYYHKIKFENSAPEQVQDQVRKIVEEDLSKGDTPIPLVRLKLVGTLAKGYSLSDVNLDFLEKDFKGKAIFSIQKDFFTQNFKTKIKELRDIQEEKKSVSALGLDLLDKQLKETGFDNAFDQRRIFKLLSENDVEKVLELLSKKE